MCTCGETETREVKATGHKEVANKPVSATCTSTGLTRGSYCSVCKVVLEEQQVVPKTDHTVVVDHAVSATCTSTGLTEGSHCSVCSTVIVKQQVVSKTSHNISNGKCTYCGQLADPYLSLAQYVRRNGTLTNSGDEYAIIKFYTLNGDRYAYSIYTNLDATELNFRMIVTYDNGLQSFVTMDIIKGASTQEAAMIITFTDGSQFYGSGDIHPSTFDGDGYLYNYVYTNSSLASSAKNIFIQELDNMLYLINKYTLPESNLGITLSDLGFYNYD